MAKRILVIEDSKELSDILAMHLRDNHYEVDTEGDGESGLARAEAGAHDLIILDLMLPGMDGIEVCRRLRTRRDYIPIIMLTSRSSELDRVLGLEIGADDYVTKPFSIPELMARVKAIFRRAEKTGHREDGTGEGVIVADGLVIDPSKRSVTLDGKPVDLTAKEFDLLLRFASNPGRVYSRAQLLDLVWGYGHDGYEHTVNSHINRLRTKIEADPARPGYIQTVWGVGYKFRDVGAGDSE